MAHGEEHPAGSGNWRAVWRDSEGARQRTSGFLNKIAARRYGEEQEALRARGIRTADSRLSWEVWCERWWRTRTIAPRTDHMQRGAFERHVLPYWEGVPLDKITRSGVQHWVAELRSGGVGPSTIKTAHAILSGSLSAAVRADLLVKNPALNADLPAESPSPGKDFTREEVATILTHLGPTNALVVQMLAFTGLRWGELTGLHWNRVHMARRTIEVVETWDSQSGQMTPYPKSRQRRTVPLPDRLLPLLVPPGARSCGRPHADGRICGSGLVITTPNGLPLDGKNWRRRVWQPALRRAGIAGRPHDLRHTYATWLIQEGASLSDIAAALGHSHAWVTQRYAHLGDAYLSHLRATLNRLDDRRSA